MKTTKKLFALLLCVLMVAALAIPAFADNDTTTLTITDTINEDATYAGYRLLDCTNSGEAYAYTVNKTYLSILKTATGKTEEDDIIAAIADLKDKSDDIRAFADKVYKAIGTMTPDEPDIDANTATSIAQGYWLIAETTKLADGAVASQVLLDTKGEDSVEVTTKKSLPTVEKKVDKNSASVGETVTFTVTAKPINYNSSYTQFDITLKDTIVKGLKINSTGAQISFTDGNGVDASYFEIKVDTEGKSITATSKKNLVGKITASTVVTLTYTATVTDDAIDSIAENGVKFTYSNDPYDTDSYQSLEDEEYVYVTNLVIDKYTGKDNDAKKLKGAKFTLKGDLGYYTLSSGKVVWSSTAQEFETDDNGAITFKGLGAGTYTLSETAAPTGYNKLKNDIIVVIACDEKGNFSAGDGSTDGVEYDGNTAKAFIAKVENTTGSELPTTGGIGTVIFVVLGSILLLGAGIVLVTNKRMSKETF